MRPVADYFAREDDFPDLDREGALARLSAAIRCKTINYADHSLTDYTEFDRLHAHMKASYPNIMRAGAFERLGHHAVLITIPGSDKALRPCLYMSHQDVVPVVEGTEQDWTHPAFSGDVADGYIWGRGTIDIKEQVFGVLEAAEYLLAHGKSFRRTAYLAFGDDEETLNLGALAISDHLKAQGVTLEFVLDEGGYKIDSGEAYGAPELAVATVELMEKGYADLELSVHSIGAAADDRHLPAGHRPAGHPANRHRLQPSGPAGRRPDHRQAEAQPIKQQGLLEKYVAANQ